MDKINALIAEDTDESANEVFKLIYHAGLDHDVLEKAYAFLKKHTGEFTVTMVKLCNDFNANWDLLNLLVTTAPLKVLTTPDEFNEIKRPHNGTIVPYDREGKRYIMVVGSEVSNYNFRDENCWYTKYQVTEELYQQLINNQEVN